MSVVTMRVRTILLSSAAACMLIAEARADSIDLGSLETLFGQPITTSVTGMPMREDEVPASMEIITADQIRRSGALDIPLVLKRYAGIDVNQWTDAHYDVGIRGYNQPYNPRLLVLVNGRQVYLDHYGMTAWTALPVQIDDIRQIEVVRGPNTALFGFNAASGVVNIITYNPIYDDVNSVRVSGTTSGIDTSATASVRLPQKYGVMLSAGVRGEKSFDDDSDKSPNGLFRADPERKNVALDSIVQLAEHTQVEFDASHVSAEINELDPTYLVSRTRYSIGSLRARLFHDSDYGLWKLSAYRNHLSAELDSAATLGVTGRSIEARNDVTVIGAENQFIPFADHAVRIGAEYRRNEFETVFSGSSTVGYEVMALSGTWHWQASEDLSFIASGRIDRLETFDNGPPLEPFNSDDYKNVYHEPSYNFGALYSLSSDDRVSLLAARGVQTASLLELAFVFPRAPINGNLPVTADPRLKPTVVNEIEIGYEHDLDAIGGKLSLAVFGQEHRHLKTVPGIGPTNVAIVNGQPVITTFNAGNSKAWGVEIGLEGRYADHFNYNTSYAYIDINDDLTVNKNGIGQPIRFAGVTPEHTVKAWIGYDDGPFTADLFMRWMSSHKSINNKGGTAFNIAHFNSDFNADARIGYKLSDRMELSFSGFNLIGADSTTTGLKIDRRFIATAKINLN